MRVFYFVFLSFSTLSLGAFKFVLLVAPQHFVMFFLPFFENYIFLVKGVLNFKEETFGIKLP